MIKDVVDTIVNLIKAPPLAGGAAPGPAVHTPAPMTTASIDDALFASRLEAAANDPDGQAIPLVAGALELVGLEDVRGALGGRWEAIADRAMAIAENELQTQLGDTDIYRYYSDFSFVVCFADLDRTEAAARASAIAVEIRAKLVQQIPEVAQVVDVEQFVADVDKGSLRGSGTSITDRLFETLQRIRQEARATARRSRQALLRDIQLQFVPAWHTSRHVVVINRCQLDQTSGSRTLAQFQAIAEPIQIDQTLAELDCMLLTRAIEKLHDAASLRPSGALLIPVSLRTLNNPRWRSEYCGLLQMMPGSYKKLLILEICDVPSTSSPDRLGELIGLLRPFVKGVSLEVAIDHPDLTHVLQQGSWALAVNITGSISIDPQVPLRLKRFAGAAAAARTISVAHGANSMGLALSAVEAGFNYIDGPAIHPTMREPKPPSSLNPLSTSNLAAKGVRW